MTFTLFIDDQCEILRRLLELYYPHGCRIIDVTYGKGSLWKMIANNPVLRRMYRVTACDAAPASRKVKKKNLFNDDYTSLGRHDCALFDPPYLIKRVAFDYAKVGRHTWSADPNRAKYTANQSLDHFNQRVECLKQKAPAFLKPGGLLLVKIMDPRKDGMLIPHHINITNILHDSFELIDLAIYDRIGAATWKLRGHLQNLHGYWLIFRLKEAKVRSSSSRKNRGIANATR